ncbi:MAG: PHP domain-containing protein, partial [Deltaproteobacteria bacterium]|nr:PHP domain-containing protein [Deltaproteobacteria bacterium]
MNNDLTEFIEYIGNPHIHSVYSDGAGSVSEIAQSAKRVGLDFIILNDHDYMTDNLHLEDEGFYKGVLALVSLEIGERFHHYLAYDLKEMVRSESLAPQEVIDRVEGQGGFGFLAHPFEKGMPFAEKSIAYTWNDLSVTGFTGVCIWNYSSRWKERVKSPIHGLFFLLFKSQMLKGPSGKTLSFWDGLCQERRVAAIGGSDAHGAVFKWHGLRFTPLSYDHLLNSINVHVLLKKALSMDF